VFRFHAQNFAPELWEAQAGNLVLAAACRQLAVIVRCESRKGAFGKLPKSEPDWRSAGWQPALPAIADAPLI